MKKYFNYFLMVLAFAVVLSGCKQKEKEPEVVEESESVEEISYDELSLKQLEVYALENDGEAAYYLGRVYDYGLMGESQNFADALKWYQVSADNEYGWGDLGLGYLYLSGCGVDQDYEKAKECFQNAVNHQCMEGYIGIARCILEQEDEDEYHTAYLAIKKCVDTKLIDGYYYMGYLYENGIEVKADYNSAVSYYELVVENESEDINDQYAINSSNTALGCIHAKGYLGEADGGKAVEYFEKAADNGFSKAQYYLGMLYETGEVVDQDYEKALTYFEAAAEKDYAPAFSQIAYIYFNGLGVDTDYGQAVYYEKLAAAQGYVPAQINLGYLYENGIGVDLNLETALAYYKLADESGYEGAQEAVTRIENLLIN